MSSHAADEIARSLQEMERLAAPPPGGPDAPRHGLAAYAHATRTATYGFLAALPLLIFYEIGIVLANTGATQIRIGADAWIKTALASLGVQGALLLGAVVVVIGGVVFWMERDRRPAIRASYFGGILVESLIYAVVLALIVSTMVGALFGAALSEGAPTLAMAQMAQLSLPLQLALSIGAGLYEELVFRVMLVGGLFLALRQVLSDKRVAYGIAAVVGALLFSWVHYTGSLGDPFTLASFTYRFLFGLALNGVFLLRGFAMAAWTHALYDVLVVTGSL
ncbi:MAG: CPBP family intramembrane glutamic endopeptidase [Bacteroidota bacterium]